MFYRALLAIIFYNVMWYIVYLLAIIFYNVMWYIVRPNYLTKQDMTKQNSGKNTTHPVNFNYISSTIRYYLEFSITICNQRSTKVLEIQCTIFDNKCHIWTYIATYRNVVLYI